MSSARMIMTNGGKRQRRRKRDPVGDLKKQWGAAIREQRQLLGMSQRQLAEAVGVDPCAVGLVSFGQPRPCWYWRDRLRSGRASRQERHGDDWNTSLGRSHS